MRKALLGQRRRTTGLEMKGGRFIGPYLSFSTIIDYDIFQFLEKNSFEGEAQLVAIEVMVAQEREPIVYMCLLDRFKGGWFFIRTDWFKIFGPCMIGILLIKSITKIG